MGLKLENEEIIDIGGGNRIYRKKLAQRGCRTVLIEPSHKMISKIKDDEILAIRGTATNIPIKRDTFDVALLINTLHHIEKVDHGMVLSEIFRILKYGGKLLVIEVFPHSLLDKIFVKIENMTVGKTYHVSPHQLELRLNEIGFHIEGMFFPKD